MDITIFEIAQLVVGSGLLTGIVYVICKVTKIDSMAQDIKEMKKDISSLNIAVGKLEVRVEERTLRVVHSHKTGTEEEK